MRVSLFSLAHVHALSIISLVLQRVRSPSPKACQDMAVGFGASRSRGADETAIPLRPLGASQATAISKGSWRDVPQGWRFGVFSGAVLATLVLLINLVTTIVVASKSRAVFSDTDGASFSLARRAKLYEGNCNTSKKLNLVVHLLINTLSTLLLSASNYAMQCLSAPTREEVDKAHNKWRWLDIGAPGLRNLGSIGRARLTLWSTLLLSSLPLHLL